MKHVCKVLFSKIGGSLEFSFGHLYFCQNSVLIFFEKVNKITMSSESLDISEPVQTTKGKLRLLVMKSLYVQMSQRVTGLAIILVPIALFSYSQISRILHPEMPELISESRYAPVQLDMPNVTYVFLFSSNTN